MKNIFSLSCNMTKNESYLRQVLALIMFLVAFFFTSWMFFIMAIMMAYTAITKHCFLYAIFDLNKQIRLNSIYLSKLPKNNPEPVFIIDKNSNVVFRNAPASSLFPSTTNFDFLLSSEEIKSIIDNETLTQIKHTFSKDKIYLFSVKGDKDIHSVLVYGTNITDVINAQQEITNTQKEVIYAMGEIGETRSKETGNHVKRVAKYSKILALKYGLSNKESELLEMASPMHDIGKVGIADAILNKPGKFTEEEFEIMKTHAELGYKMLKGSSKEILKAASIVSYEHHEKWDGSGYPRGLSGEDIHIYGRITAVADVFDALGSDRVYKKAWELDRIFDLFKEQRGKHFDPKLIDLFFEHFDEFNEVRLKYKDIEKNS